MKLAIWLLPSLLSLSLPLLAEVLAAKPAASEAMSSLFSVDGYRISQYRSPTPSQIDDAVTLDTTALRRLLEQHPDTALLNVQALTWRNGVFIEQAPRNQIPGSLWLPNVGKGKLEPRWEAYFRAQLGQLRNAGDETPLVFYCRADCWMSWNATRRAASWGYTERLYWYPEGSDGWQDANLPVERAVPVPLPFELSGSKQPLNMPVAIEQK